MAFFEILEQKVPAKLIASVGLGLGVLTMAGCAETAQAEPGPATVVEHHYRPSYTTVIMVGRVPVVQYHPADYDLGLKQCDREGDKFADAEGCVKLEVDVTEEIYNKYPDGSEITLPIQE